MSVGLNECLHLKHSVGLAMTGVFFGGGGQEGLVQTTGIALMVTCVLFAYCFVSRLDVLC